MEAVIGLIARSVVRVGRDPIIVVTQGLCPDLARGESLRGLRQAVPPNIERPGDAPTGILRDDLAESVEGIVRIVDTVFRLDRIGARQHAARVLLVP